MNNLRLKFIQVLGFVRRALFFLNPFELMDWAGYGPKPGSLYAPIYLYVFNSEWLLNSKFMRCFARVLCALIALTLFHAYSTIISIFFYKHPNILSFSLMSMFMFFVLFLAGSIVSKMFFRMYLNAAKRIVKYVCFFFLSFFLFNFVILFFINSQLLHKVCYDIEVPFLSLRGIAIDSEERVYVGSDFYNRVQVYDKHGEFLSGWFTVLKSFHILVDPNDNLRVAKGNIDEYYNFKGDLLSIKKNSISEYFKEFGHERDLMEQSYAGDYYLIDGIFSYKITRIDAEGNATTFLKGPIRSRLVDTFLPALIFILLCFCN